MKPASLSMRLGLTVSVMGALLVVLLAILAFFALTHELDSLAKNSLEKKMQQIRHSLAADLSVSEIARKPHSLLDQVLGHDNLNLTILDRNTPPTRLLSVGSPLPPLTQAIAPSQERLSYFSRSDGEGQHFLTASQLMPLPNGDRVAVLLSVDRSNDEALLSAYLSSTLIALPLLLILIGIGAWAIVRRGLAPLREFRKVAAMVSTQELNHRLAESNMPQELSELAHGINFMLHRLDNGVQQLSQFSDDIAHELRSPISNLMGKAQVTLSRERPSEEYKAVLETCTEELTRVTRIVADMLFLAQVSHPAALVPFERIELADEVRKVAELFDLSAEDKHVSLQVSGSGATLGDRLMIQRAISNLLSNAIRHCPPGKSITLVVERHSEHVTLRVGNPGPGIAEEHLPHLFERFYRVDNSRSRAQGGTGLGLAIVRSIMSLHQGTVQVQSTPNSWTEFCLVFPGADKT